jgi:polyhydroxybutyrate depolymerase
MPFLALAFPLVAVAISAGCTAGAPQNVSTVPGETSVQRIEIDGQPREFRVFRPEKLPESAPLVVMIHGWGFTAEQIERDYGWNDVAEKHQFVVAYPQGVGLSFNAAGDCCGPAADNDVDDVAFITAIVERLQKALPIDNDRIYAAGMSNGGVMAYALACRTSLFAAIGVVAGTQVGGCRVPRPTSVIQVHGLADTIVRLDGGPAIVPGAQPVPRVVSNWRRISSCQDPERSQRSLVTTIRAECADNREVTLVTIDGEGHTWPGHAGSTAPWDATTELWQFFSNRSARDGGVEPLR